MSTIRDRTTMINAEKIYDPSNPRRFHHRLEARTQPHPDIPTDRPRHLHMDMEAELRDATKEVNAADCSIDKVNGFAVLTVLPSEISNDQIDQWNDSAEAFVATCGSHGQKTLIGKPRKLRDDNGELKPVVVRDVESGLVSIYVDTTFKSEYDKFVLAYDWWKLQSYGGEQPIQASKHLGYMKTIDADAHKFYSEMDARYRPNNSVRSEVAPKRRQLQVDVTADCSEATIDGADSNVDCTASASAKVFNCDTISDSETNPGCADYTDESIALIENFETEYGGTTFDISLSCVECAITIAGASAYTYVEGSGTALSYSIDFSVGAEIKDAVADWALLLEVVIEPSENSSEEGAVVTLLDEFVPGLSLGASFFGVDVNAGLKFVTTVTPDIDIEGDLAVQVGSKMIFNAEVGVTGSAGLSGVDLSQSGGSFSFENRIDTPQITAQIVGEFEQVYNLELRFGLFTDAGSAGSGEFYGAVGLPILFDGTFAIDSTSLLATIPDSYCDLNEPTDTDIFIGDCTQSNNQQVQFSLGLGDVYARAVAVASFDIGIASLGFEYQADFPSDVLAGLTPDIGPFTLTYCDCIEYDGIDCSASADGVCGADKYPPVEQTRVPKYTAASPPSGMDLANAGTALSGATNLTPSLTCLLGVMAAWFYSSKRH